MLLPVAAAVNDKFGVMVKIAVCVAPPAAAEIVAVDAKLTPKVLTVKVALVAPAGTVTAAGTVARDGVSLRRLTAVPPAGAGPVSVTVPVEEEPPATDAGDSERLRTEGGGAVMVTAAVPVTPPLRAATVAEPAEAGAVYRPPVLMPPPPAATDQATPGRGLRAAPNWSVAEALNCWVAPAPTVAVDGATETVVTVAFTGTPTVLAAVSPAALVRTTWNV